MLRIAQKVSAFRETPCDAAQPCAPAGPLQRGWLSFDVEAVEKPQIGTNLLKNSAEEKSKMGMETPVKARQSLHGKDLKTLPKEGKHVGSFIVLYRARFIGMRRRTFPTASLVSLKIRYRDERLQIPRFP